VDRDDLDFKRDIKIDPDALDVEWLDQPDVMLEYSLAQSEAEEEREDAKLEVEKAKDKVTETKAKRAMEIRKNPSKHGLDKVTDSSISAAVEIDKEVMKAKQRYYDAVTEFNKAKYVYSKLHSAVKSFEQRKVSLENLVRLLGLQYFAAPATERNLSEEYASRYQQKIARTKKEAKEKIKERRRTK